ncbi:hypothetical protein BGZ72_005751 [Mortierella alpina]|nr:hypothetical protein BGZ72_005751 [Mortierella alpina]
MPPRQTTANKSAGTVRAARKRKNADRSDEEDDDFAYTHQQQRPLQQRATKVNPARSARQQQQQQTVPSLSSSDSPSPTAPMDMGARDHEDWRPELSEKKRAKRFTEEDRGFVFTRKKVAATGTKRADTANNASDMRNATLGVPHSPSTSQRIQSRNASLDDHVPTRNATRVTGGTRRQQQQQQRRQRQQTPENTTEAIIEIPMRETPMIQKNKDLRSGSRRSSFTMRGKRASSIGNGCSAMPHPSVEPKSFFRHISAEDPPPIRMRQLMAWCARKCIDTQKGRSQTALKLAKQIEEDALAMLVANEFNISWYSRPLDTEPIRTAPKKPHQQNVENQRKLKECEAQIAKLRKEDEEWTGVISSFNTFHASLLDNGPKLPPGDDPVFMPDTVTDEVELELLTEEERGLWEKHCAHSDSANSIARVPQSPKTSTKENHQWMLEMMSTLEKEVDSLQDTLYAASSLDKVAKRYTDEILEQIAVALDDRQRPPTLEAIFLPAAAPSLPSSSSTSVAAATMLSASTAPVAEGSIEDPRDILRALSRLSI